MNAFDFEMWNWMKGEVNRKIKLRDEFKMKKSKNNNRFCRAEFNNAHKHLESYWEGHIVVCTVCIIVHIRSTVSRIGSTCSMHENKNLVYEFVNYNL